MGDITPLEYPHNRIVAVFSNLEDASGAQSALVDVVKQGEEIRLFNGRSSAEEVDASAKWFADTDLDIARFKRALDAGNVILSVPVEDEQQSEVTKEKLAAHGATLATHFGDLTNSTENLNPNTEPRAE